MSGLDLTTYESTELHGSYAWTDTLKGVYYGPGQLATALPKLLKAIGAKKALIVTGKSLYTKTDVVKKVEAVLRQYDAYAGSFYEIGQHSPVADIRRGLKAFKDGGADAIVAVGGGSPTDASKVLLYLLQQETGGPYLPQIAIPTTLSAAEYSVGGGYLNDEGHKVAVSHPHLAPSGVILDAELTLATPDRLWLSTGMRAVDHAVETLYRPLVPPPIKYLAYAALADLFKYLPLAKANPKAVDIRQKLQVASWMSLWPMKLEKYSALGLSHSLGHKLGGKYGIPHGITSCLTLAPTVALKAEIASEEDKRWLSDALFYLRKPFTDSVEGDIHKLSAEIDGLVVGLGLRSSLEEYNLPRKDLPTIAELALGRKDDPAYDKVLKILEDIYSQN